MTSQQQLRSHARRVWDEADRYAPWILLAFAFFVRVQNLDTAPYGDEAYWYFTAQKLSHFLNTGLYPLSGSEFPVLPLLYRPFAWSFTAARIANAGVGAAIVPIGMLALRQAGVARGWRWAAGLLLAVDPVMVQFSALLFLDMLGATIAALSLWAYVVGRYRWAALLAVAAVLEKEYFAIFAAALFIDDLVRRRRLYWELIAGAAVVGLYIAVRYGLLHASLQYLLTGHAHDALSWQAVKWAVGSTFLLVPLMAAAVGLTRTRLLAGGLFVALFLVFLWRWGNTEIWYLCAPAAFSILLAAAGADALLKRAPAGGARIALTVMAAALIVGGGLEAGRDTLGFTQNQHDHSMANLVGYMEAVGASGHVDLVGCFWAYKYYPFGEPPYQAAATQSWDKATFDQAVSCPGAPAPPPGWSKSFDSAGYAYWRRG